MPIYVKSDERSDQHGAWEQTDDLGTDFEDDGCGWDDEDDEDDDSDQNFEPYDKNDGRGPNKDKY